MPPESPDAAESPSSDLPRSPAAAKSLANYWQSNVRVLLILMTAWGIVGLGCGVLFADWLNQWSLGGYPLGFWFAQQGSIIGFVLIILIYCVTMNRLDTKHHRELEELGEIRTGTETKPSGGAS